MEQPIEYHPFEPFLPFNARVLFLGSFPPQEKRWSMQFFYPNFTNDFWWMCGLLWFGDKEYFARRREKRFDLEQVREFCSAAGFALFDTARAVRRLKDNASDKFLEVVEPTDIGELLRGIPICNTIVTTGQKATETLAQRYGCAIPSIGEKVEVDIPIEGEGVRRCAFYRMPSTSRAYPLSLEKKAAIYAKMFRAIGILE